MALADFVQPLVSFIVGAGAAYVLTMRWQDKRRTSAFGSELRRAIERHEFEVYYQPVTDLETGQCVGVEALLRWPHPKEGMVPPAVFVAVAERDSLLKPMTEWLMDKVANDLGALLQARPAWSIAINVPAMLFSDAWLPECVDRIFVGRLAHRQLVFEVISHGLGKEDASAVYEVIRTLRERGIRTAVDDYGIGFSSLEVLKRWAPDQLKIDRAFVEGIESEDRSSGLVDVVIDVGRQLSIEVIAEGVERKAQTAYLLDRGVKRAQGWYFAPPMTVAAFRQFVANQEHKRKREQSS